MLKKNESLNFRFTFRLNIDGADRYDPYNDNYFNYMESPIILEKAYENTIRKKKIGSIVLIYLHGNRAFNNDMDIVDICDSESQEIYEYANSIYHNGYINEKYNDMPRSNDVLILHKIMINKKYQGRGYGLIISKKVIEVIGSNCGAVLIKPYPIQFSLDKENKDEWNNDYLSERFNSDKENCRKKILKYWRQLSKHTPINKTANPNIICFPQS